MKSEKEINEAIIKIISLIQDSYPELSKYLLERPAKIIDSFDPEVDVKTLTAYYESLVGMVKNYAITHGELAT